MKWWVVAEWELRSTVLKKSYLLSLIGLPLLMGGIVAISMFSAGSFGGGADFQKVGYVDETGGFDLEGNYTGDGTSPSGNVTYRFVEYDSAGRAEADLLNGSISSFAVVHGDYRETGRVDTYVAKGKDLNSFPVSVLERRLLDRLLGEELEPLLLERAKHPVAEERHTLDEDGEDSGGVFEFLATTFAPFGVAFILMLSVITSSSLLMQGIIRDKQDRVGEILLSSTGPRQIILGKVLGLGAAGLLQATVWTGMAVIPASMFLATAFLTPVTALLGLVYFLLGFLFYSGILAAIAAAAKDQKQAGRAVAPIMLFIWLPMMFLIQFLEAPNSTIPRALSLFPPTAPMAMLARWSGGTLPLPDLLAGITLLAASALLAIEVAARILERGMLETGSRLSLPSVMRALKRG